MPSSESDSDGEDTFDVLEKSGETSQPIDKLAAARARPQNFQTPLSQSSKLDKSSDIQGGRFSELGTDKTESATTCKRAIFNDDGFHAHNLLKFDHGRAVTDDEDKFESTATPVQRPPAANQPSTSSKTITRKRRVVLDEESRTNVEHKRYKQGYCSEAYVHDYSSIPIDPYVRRPDGPNKNSTRGRYRLDDRGFASFILNGAPEFEIWNTFGIPFTMDMRVLAHQLAPLPPYHNRATLFVECDEARRATSAGYMECIPLSSVTNSHNGLIKVYRLRGGTVTNTLTASIHIADVYSGPIQP